MASGSPAVNPVFRPLLPQLTGVRIPVLLPTYLPRQTTAGVHLYATLDERSPRSYLINLGFASTCHGATACRFGQVTGGPEVGTPTAFDDPRKRQVRLHNGAPALYYPYACGASCGDSTIVFQTKGVTYTVGLKAGSLSDVLAMANSVAPATGVTATTTPSPAPTGTPAAGHAIRTVFIIVLENHNWSSITGNASAPYINHTLLPLGAHAEQYYNPPGNHPSEPNYLWLEAGTNFGIHNDNAPASTRMARPYAPWRRSSASARCWATPPGRPTCATCSPRSHSGAGGPADGHAVARQDSQPGRADPADQRGVRAGDAGEDPHRGRSAVGRIESRALVGLLRPQRR